MTLPVQPRLPVSQIVQGKNPRKYFDPDEMKELEHSVLLSGVLQPIIVRPVAGTDRYEIIAGERRWRAAKAVCGDDYDIAVTVCDADDDSALVMSVVENYHRAGMSPAEEARAAQQHLQRPRGNKQETAHLMGWSPDMLERRLALLSCTPAVLEALGTRRIGLGHAELLAGIAPDKQDTVLAVITAQKVPVAVLKAQLGRYARRLEDAIFDTAQCSGCVHNSARQALLFSESLGQGYCQHPSHFDELTQQAVESRADALRDQYPVIRIARAGDGAAPLPLSADGELGVGALQYASCQGCQSFGCTVSAMPGSYGQVTHSLCFDGACNSQKVALWSKVQRDAQAPAAGADDEVADKPAPAQPQAAKTAPANQTPQRVLSYRNAQWRDWLAKALMAQPQRSQRVLIALTLAGRSGDLSTKDFCDRYGQIEGDPQTTAQGLRAAVQRADGACQSHLDQLVQAAGACAAFGVGSADLELLLNYAQVDEGQYFQWNKEFLELFTASELESLAQEAGLKKAMGPKGFKRARAEKKPQFISALLKVQGFNYQDTVPAVMRYPRRAVTEVADTQ